MPLHRPCTPFGARLGLLWYITSLPCLRKLDPYFYALVSARAKIYTTPHPKSRFSFTKTFALCREWAHTLFMPNATRLDALLSQLGYCARRQTQDYIKQHAICLQEVRLTAPNHKVSDADLDFLTIDCEPLDHPHGICVALHKPLGVTCSHDPAEGPLIYDLLPARWLNRKPSISTVGRLDKDTSGIILITDDGKLAHRLTSPKHHVAKVYQFTTATPVPQSAIELFVSGNLLLAGERTPCLPAQLFLNPQATSGTLTLLEGRYHQARRMLAHLGTPILTLHRTQFGEFALQDLNLKQGEWVSV